MSEQSPAPKPGTKRSHYQEFLLQLEEVRRHKWIESEKQNRDIGFEEALVDWMKNHREDWRNKWMKDTKSK